MEIAISLRAGILCEPLEELSQELSLGEVDRFRRNASISR